MPAVRSRERRGGTDSNHETIGIVRSEEDEEKDRTGATDKCEREGYLEEEDGSETA